MSKTFSKKLRNQTMKIIQNYLYDNAPQQSLSANKLYDLGLSRKIDVNRLIDVLCGLGYIKSTKLPNGMHIQIKLTDTGNSYFERNSDAVREFLLKSVVVPIAVSIITAIITASITVIITVSSETSQGYASHLQPQQTLQQILQQTEPPKTTDTPNSVPEDTRKIRIYNPPTPSPAPNETFLTPSLPYSTIPPLTFIKRK